MTVVRVLALYFAAARDAAGRASETIDLPEGATVATLLDVVVRAHPALARLVPALRLAVDERFAPRTHALDSGQTIAFLPPASGG